MGQGHTSISAREHKQLSVETVQFCITAPNDQHVGRKKNSLKKDTRALHLSTAITQN